MTVRSLLYLASMVIACGFAFPVEASAVADNPYQGRLVKADSSTAVYYIGVDNKRHAFPNAKIYFSWFEDFKQVEVIDDFSMSLYPLGRNVLYRPASRLVKISDVPEVYAVEPGGVLRNIPSEEVAIALYGNAWADLVDDLDISFFFDYEIGGVLDVIDTKPVYPRGTAVRLDSDLFIVDKTATGDFWLRPITSEAWRYNRFDRADVYSITPAWRELYNLGLPIVIAESGYACPACEPTWSDDPAYTYSERTSDNHKYALQLPTSWGISFFDQESMNEADILMATESLTGDGARVSVQREAMSDDINAQNMVQRLVSQAEAQQLRVFWHGASQTRFGAMDIVRARPFDQANGELMWSRIIASGNDLYTVTVTAPWSMIGRYREALHTAIQSFSVDERIQ